MHTTKYAVEFQRSWTDPQTNQRRVSNNVFKVWADSGRAAISQCVRVRQISRDQIKAVYEMQDGQRVRVL